MLGQTTARLFMSALLFSISGAILNPASAQMAGLRTNRAQERIASAIPKYDLNIRLFPDSHRIETTGTMRMPAANTMRAQFQLSLSEQMREFRVVVVEPVECVGTARLESSSASGKSIRWTVYPPRPLPAGKSVLIRFSYAGGAETAPFFHISTEVSFASAWGTDWYPLVVGDDDKGIGTFRFSVPAGLTVIAEGNRLNSCEEAAQGIFQFESIHPAYFSFAAGKYTTVRRDGPVPVSVYLLHPRENMEKYLEGVSRIITVLAHEFGPYPFREFALVEVPRELANRAGFNAGSVQGFVYANSGAFGAPIDVLLGWFGHEFSHQWFPHRVALKTPPGLYMEEAMAEYGGVRVVETISGAAAAERYRRKGFEPDPIYSALEYFKLVGQGVDQPLAHLQTKAEHRNLAYNKGFLVFDMLSREIGRRKFQRILHNITQRNAFKSLTWQQFLRAIELGAGKDLGWFYEQWFERGGAPEWQLTWRQEANKIRSVITQSDPYYRATLELEIQGSEGHRMIRLVKCQGARTEVTVPVRFRVEAILLDPHYLTLRWTPEYHAAADTASVRQKRYQ